MNIALYSTSGRLSRSDYDSVIDVYKKLKELAEECEQFEFASIYCNSEIVFELLKIALFDKDVVVSAVDVERCGTDFCDAHDTFILSIGNDMEIFVEPAYINDVLAINEAKYAMIADASLYRDCAIDIFASLYGIDSESMRVIMKDVSDLLTDGGLYYDESFIIF